MDNLSKDWQIYKRVDELIEKAQIQELCLIDTLNLLMPYLLNIINCDSIFIKTYDEDLTKKLYKFYKPPINNIVADFHLIEEYSKKDKIYIDIDDDYTTISLRIDVSGVYFGFFGACFTKRLSKEMCDEKAHELNIAIEVIDNYLSMIYNSNKKQKAIRTISEALDDRIFDRGMDIAIKKFFNNIEFDRILFIYKTDMQPGERKDIRYIVYDKTRRITDSEDIKDNEIDQILRSKDFAQVIWKETKISYKILEKLKIRNYIEKALIYGKSKEHLVGKIYISRISKKFNTTQIDILNNFATLLRQRIVDFNKEYQNLASSFPSKIINRLISEDNYKEKYISPREKHVAIVYNDIVGFTKITEQILTKPSEIVDFLNEWSSLCIDIIWKYGGIFDKMVGDCIISFFGPPFYENEPKELCINAISASIEINRVTEKLSKKKKYRKIQDSEIISHLGISTAINYCPIFIGRFGPNKDFTGFSKGMNNTARLESLAGYRDILITRSVKDILGQDIQGFSIGEEKKEKVKNVKDSLFFYPLIYDI